MEVSPQTIQKWIEQTCQEKFQGPLEKLSSINLFYLYHEIEREYQIRIPMDKIEEGVLNKTGKASEYLYDQMK